MHDQLLRQAGAAWKRVRQRVDTRSTPLPTLSEELQAELVAPLFNRLASLLVAHGAPLFLCFYISERTGALWPLGFLGCDIVILALRCWILCSVKRRQPLPPAAMLRAARPYFAVGLAWSLSTGAFCCACFMLQMDSPILILTATMVIGTAGGTSSRNAATPRFAIAQISALLLPQALVALWVVGWGQVYAALLLVCYVALVSIVRRQYRDVISLMLTQREKSAVAARFDAALGNMSQGLTQCGADGVLQVVNRQFYDILCIPQGVVGVGDTAAAIVARLAAHPVPGADANVATLGLARLPASGQDRQTGSVLALPGNRYVALRQELLPDGGWVTTYADVTESQQVKLRIEHVARHDALTGLPNRTVFSEALAAAVARLRDGEPFTVFYLDLDRFKAVNDGLGHAVGDMLLTHVASRIKATLRTQDLIVRLGGDEFAAILPGLHLTEEARDVAARLVEVVGASYQIDEHSVNIGLSVGIALAPQAADTAELLLQCADMALYDAKATGRGRYRFFDAGMARRQQSRRRLEAELRLALPRDELELFYQPVVETAGCRPVRFEALLRWRHPEMGLVQPGDFITIAEETGLIVPIGHWVLRTACAEAAGWPQSVQVAVNISGVQFYGGDLFAQVTAALAESGLPAARLELELTEAVLLKDSPATLDLLHRLRALGVHIALDDFGTGYSSLSYLRHFPLDRIKIDRSFVRDLACDGADGQTRREGTDVAIIRAITGLAAALGLAVTAEGVETAAQLRQIRALGCGEAQGYFFSPPQPAAAVPQLLRQFAAALPVVADEPAARILSLVR